MITQCAGVSIIPAGVYIQPSLIFIAPQGSALAHYPLFRRFFNLFHILLTRLKRMFQEITVPVPVQVSMQVPQG